MPKLEDHIVGVPNWVDVTVETIEQRDALMSFFTSLYGWTWEVGGEEMGHYSIAQYEGAPVFGVGVGPGGAGAMVPYFATDDINATAAKAAELGGTVIMGPMEVPEAGTMALVTDPTGAVHGLWQAGNFKGFGVAYEPEPGMRVLSAGEQWFASVSENQVDERTTAQWNSIYVVETLEAARNKIRELGGTIVLEEMPVPGSAISVFVEPVMKTAITIMGAGSHE